MTFNLTRLGDSLPPVAAADVFLQFVVVFRGDQILPAYNVKHYVNINLIVSICHRSNMPLLRSLSQFWVRVNTNIPPLRGWSCGMLA